MDSRTYAIGVLSIIAVVLLAALILVNMPLQHAVASNVGSYGGDFTVTVGRVTPDTELVYVVDNKTQRLLAYAIDRRSGKTQIMDKADLAQP